MRSSSGAEKIGLILGKELQSGDNYLCLGKRSKQEEKKKVLAPVKYKQYPWNWLVLESNFLFASVSLRFIIDLEDLEVNLEALEVILSPYVEFF